MIAERVAQLDLNPTQVTDLVMAAVEYAEKYNDDALREIALRMQRRDEED